MAWPHKTISTWFRIYSLLFIICALACLIGLTIHRHFHRTPGSKAQSYRGAMDRLIAEAIPPGWTARRGLYLTRIDDADGAPRAFAYIGLAGDRRPFLAAGRYTVTGIVPSAWDVADPAYPAKSKAWLAGITRPSTGDAANGPRDMERSVPSAHR